MDTKTVLKELMVNNMFLTEFDLDQSKMCLKNEKDEVVFQFKLIEGKTTLESLKIAAKKLYDTIDCAIEGREF